jgi:hypothetical protein
VRAAIRLTSRTRRITAEHERSAADRALARAMRRSMQEIIATRLADLAVGSASQELWARLNRHMPSCEYVQALENPLSGTLLGFPFSCRVPGCPYCESARVGELRRRYLPAIEQARRPKAVTLTVPNVEIGQLQAGWKAIGLAFGRLRRSPLFRGGRCRLSSIGCLASLTPGQLEERARCGGRCVRRKAVALGRAVHRGCRPCRGHEPVVAALLALEATIGKDRSGWHPHANLLFDGPFILKPWLDAAWARAMGLETAHTWIRDARRAPRAHQGDWTLEHALNETVKYAIKPDRNLINSAQPSWFIEWVEARAGLRLVRSYGAWFARPDLDRQVASTEETVRLTDPASFRTFVAPRLDPLVDEEADWQILPFDQSRRAFARFRPPGAGRRAWLVGHPGIQLHGDDE